MEPNPDGAASGDADGVAVGEVVGLMVPGLDTARLGELVGEAVRVGVGLTVGDGL